VEGRLDLGATWLGSTGVGGVCLVGGGVSC
jgi:hypothetical protein